MSADFIGHVALCVEDLDQAVQFYRQLGLSLSYRTADMAYFFCSSQDSRPLNAPEQGIALMRVGSAEAKPHIGFACLSQADVEQRHRALTQQGVTVTPIQRVGETAAFYGQDPSGNWFEYLFEPAANTTVQHHPSSVRSRAKGFG